MARRDSRGTKRPPISLRPVAEEPGTAPSGAVNPASRNAAEGKVPNQGFTPVRKVAPVARK